MQGAGWPVALPRAAGETGKAKAQGTKLSPALGRGQQSGWDRGPPGCPLAVPMGWAAGRLDKAIPQQLKVAGAVLVLSSQRGWGRMERDVNISDLGGGEEEEEGASVSPSSASGSSGAFPASAAAGREQSSDHGGVPAPPSHTSSLANVFGSSTPSRLGSP